MRLSQQQPAGTGGGHHHPTLAAAQVRIDRKCEAQYVGMESNGFATSTHEYRDVGETLVHACERNLLLSQAETGKDDHAELIKVSLPPCYRRNWLLARWLCFDKLSMAAEFAPFRTWEQVCYASSDCSWRSYKARYRPSGSAMRASWVPCWTMVPSSSTRM